MTDGTIGLQITGLIPKRGVTGKTDVAPARSCLCHERLRRQKKQSPSFKWIDGDRNGMQKPMSEMIG